MSEPSRSGLVAVGTLGLATAQSANPLVGRGLLDIARDESNSYSRLRSEFPFSIEILAKGRLGFRPLNYGLVPEATLAVTPGLVTISNDVIKTTCERHVDRLSEKTDVNGIPILLRKHLWRGWTDRGFDLKAFEFDFYADELVTDSLGENIARMQDALPISILNMQLSPGADGAFLGCLQRTEWLQLKLDHRRSIARDLDRLSRLRDLDGLDLSLKNSDAGDDCLAMLSSFARTQLMELDLSNCSSITDAGLAHLGSNVSLSSLCLSGCSISGVGLECLRNNPNPNLECLDFSYCRNFDDKGLSCISSIISFYGKLNLKGTRITDEGLLLLSTMSYEELDVSECENISESGVDALYRVNKTGVITYGTGE